MSRIECRGGFTLIELLVSMVAVATMLLGIVQFFILEHRTHSQQDQSVSMEENLRLASAVLTDALRNSRYAAPSGNPSAWIDWVSGITMTGNPTWTNNSGSTPDVMTVAGCYSEPVGMLSAPAVKDVDTVLSINPTGTLTDDLDTTSKSLIRIGESEFARVMSVSSTSITIDTDLGTAGNQPVAFAHPELAEICRVDAITFSVGNDPSTGVPRLLRDENQGAGVQAVAEGITNMQFILTSPKRFTIDLSARSELRDPITKDFLQRTLRTEVTLRN